MGAKNLWLKFWRRTSKGKTPTLRHGGRRSSSPGGGKSATPTITAGHTRRYGRGWNGRESSTSGIGSSSITSGRSGEGLSKRSREPLLPHPKAKPEQGRLRRQSRRLLRHQPRLHRRGWTFRDSGRISRPVIPKNSEFQSGVLQTCCGQAKHKAHRGCDDQVSPVSAL